MRVIGTLVLLIATLLAGCGAPPKSAELYAPEPSSLLASSDDTQALQAYEKRVSNVWISGVGQVKKLLADDNKGSRHQRFLVSMRNGKTLMFAHNIDLASRVEGIQVGDTIEYRGEYVFNPKGGVVHWTHHDPQGHKAGGWIKHNGKTYE